MCGRFVLTMPVEAMEELFGAIAAEGLPDRARYNICPTQTIPAVVSEDDRRRIEPMRWGFIPHWYKAPNDGPLLINARAETVADKPAFRAAVRERRCLIPATGFYEWTKDADGKRLPWYIHPARSNSGLAFAGIWQDWTPKDGDTLRTVAILTTAASPELSEIHHRMPVVIDPDGFALWLGESGKGAARLLDSRRQNYFEKYRVDSRVNGMKSDDPQLLDPVQI